MSSKNLNMENENLSSSQEYKKKFFSNTDSFFSKKPKYIYPEVKDTTKILSTIASKPNFFQVRHRYKTKKFLSKFLLKSHLNWVLYCFTRKNTLYIATKNHIGQSELNLQKMTILLYCSKSLNFKDIKIVSIFRDKDYLENIQDTNKLYETSYKERSYGIFENNLTNAKHKNILDKIKKNIRKNINK